MSVLTPSPTPSPTLGKQAAEAQFVVNQSRQYLGTPYVWGGSKPGGFDCSGLLQYVWGKAGVSIPRTTYQQFTTGVAVDKSQLQPGDAVFFTGSDPKGGLPGHVGIYIGGGKIIEAPHTGASVEVSSLAGRSDFVGARRYGLGTQPSPAVAASTTPQGAATGTLPHAPAPAFQKLPPDPGQAKTLAALRALLAQSTPKAAAVNPGFAPISLPAAVAPVPVAAFRSPLAGQYGAPLASLAR